MVDKYSIQDAAIQFLNAVRLADEKTLNDAYQYIATKANTSDHTYTHEPWSGVAVAIQAEFRRRSLAEGE